MKIDFSSYHSEPREMKDGTIDLVSTSLKTADASPIILNKTEMIQTKFEPVLVENDNAGGNVCDFIYQNNLTQNIALIEIKTPCTVLFGSQYRGTYSLSPDLSGAINQIINYKDKLTKDYYANCHNSSTFFEVLAPKCFLIIGKIQGLNRIQIAALENYRNSLTNVTIITFDELIQRTKDMVAVFSSEAENENIDIEEVDDLPF